MTNNSTVPVYNWEQEVKTNKSLQNINKYMEGILAKMSGPAPPPPRSDAGRGGSRYQPPPPAPAVKTEQRPPAAMPVANASAGGGYENSGDTTPLSLSYESSEPDMREIDPMDELSDFESDSQQSQRLEPVQERAEAEPMEQQQAEPVEQQQEEPMEQPMDVEMDAAPEEDHGEEADAEDEEDEKEHTACEVCKSSEREPEIMLCDDCDAEYHIFCLQPPLPKVPEGTWYCPKCLVNHPEAAAGVSSAAAVDVKQENVRAAAASAGASESGGTGAAPAAMVDEANDAAAGAPGTARDAPPAGNAPPRGADGNDPTSISIVQALQGNPESSNALLVHACNCDEMQCKDPEFQVFCPCMKRFLRGVCWASHNEKWRSFAIARATVDMFAYHAMHCQLPECNVPLCVTIRAEEIV